MSKLGIRTNLLSNRLFRARPFATVPSMSIASQDSRDYQSAIDALNSLQSNATTLEALRKSGGRMNETSLPEMLEWLRRTGYQTRDLDKLNVVHVTGTKGKGSTCAFVSSMMRTVRKADGKHYKVGLFTSPHLKSVRERIQIDGQPIPEPLFAKYFFKVWDALEAAARKAGEPTSNKPVYFRYLTLMSWITFLEENVDTMVMEVGVGGQYDSTNIIERPTVTGVTALGIDHVTVLGDTIQSIAWHKGGIFKKGVLALSVPQCQEAIYVLKDRAESKGAEFQVVDESQLPTGTKLGLEGDFQKQNASLAVSLVKEHLRVIGHPGQGANSNVDSALLNGLKSARWSGRCETRLIENVQWCLDGAHTHESLQVSGQWYSTVLERSPKPRTSILLFNQQTRNAPLLLDTLLKHCGIDDVFQHAVFCTNVTWKDRGYEGDLKSINVNGDDVTSLKVQKELAEHWRSIHRSGSVNIFGSVEEAVIFIEGIGAQNPAQRVDVFSTGSLHLIGGVLTVLDSR